MHHLNPWSPSPKFAHRPVHSLGRLCGLIIIMEAAQKQAHRALFLLVLDEGVWQADVDSRLGRGIVANSKHREA